MSGDLVNVNQDIVTETLETYAQRGVFRAFSCISRSKTEVRYRMQWHKDRFFDLTFHPAQRALRFEAVLPNAPAQMYADFKRFVAERQSDALPEHRRIDSRKVRITCSRTKGDIALLFRAKDGEVEYAVRKLIDLVHQVYQVFLRDGLYYEYMIGTFEVDRDQLS
jgi:hypothetical protein